MNYQAISFTARETAQLVELSDEAPLAADEVAGSTLYTLISPGTELAGSYLGQRFPARPGYAAVFCVDKVGEHVEGVEIGDRLFCMGNHQSRQRIRASETVRVPGELTSVLAPFCRLMGVTMTTLQTTLARPPAHVLVTGLGPVGHLCAQVFAAYGYDVIAVDPLQERRQWAERAGIARVEAAVPLDDARIARKIDLHIECSGHELAALDGCKIVKKKGEVALVGAPWSPRADVQGHEFLREIFFNYVILRSGWEWELPHREQDFRQGSIFANFAAALRLLNERRVVVDDLYEILEPSACQSVYQDLLNRRSAALFQLFDWEQSS
jgi:threonine dehydrogenase-like Zn-dependent dehydrogenase